MIPSHDPELDIDMFVIYGVLRDDKYVFEMSLDNFRILEDGLLKTSKAREYSRDYSYNHYVSITGKTKGRRGQSVPGYLVSLVNKEYETCETLILGEITPNGLVELKLDIEAYQYIKNKLIRIHESRVYLRKYKINKNMTNPKRKFKIKPSLMLDIKSE